MTIETVTLNAEVLFTELLPHARRAHAMDRWVGVARNFVNQQDLALRQARDALREQLGVRAQLAEAQTEIAGLRDLLEEALPYLREGVGHCESCEGAGVVVHGTSDENSYEETCPGCKDLQELIERIEPQMPKPAPRPEPEEDDDIAF